MQKQTSFFKAYVAYPAQALVAAPFYGLFRILPVDVASAIGGLLARTIGPSLSVSDRAIVNLKRVYPDKSPSEITKIVKGMWDNLGRTAAEYPHAARINTIGPDARAVVDRDDIFQNMVDRDGPCIIVSGHFANWEILPASAAQRGLRAVLVYRAANNPLVDWLFRRRKGHAEASIAPKGIRGARILLKAMKEGKTVGILADQKMNDGIPVPFFGKDVMTAPALAELALRFGCPVVPVHVVRTKGARFKVVVEEPIEVMASGDRAADVLALMTQVNKRMERWVREAPEQWLWLHNRWPK